MNKEEILKEIMELPRIETNNSISAMNVIKVDDLMSAVDRLNKIPDYNDLLKENQELKKQLEEIYKFKFSYRKDETKMPPIIRKQKDVEIIKNLENQQKEFIKYLENMLDNENDIFSVVRVKDVLQKYKEIAGVSDDKK